MLLDLQGWLCCCSNNYHGSCKQKCCNWIRGVCNSFILQMFGHFFYLFVIVNGNVYFDHQSSNSTGSDLWVLLWLFPLITYCCPSTLILSPIFPYPVLFETYSIPSLSNLEHLNAAGPCIYLIDYELLKIEDSASWICASYCEHSTNFRQMNKGRPSPL